MVIALAPLIIALVALLAYLGAPLAIWLADQIIPSLPFIGGFLKNAVKSAINDLVGAARYVFGTWALGLAFVIQAVTLTLWWAIWFIVTPIVRVWGELYNVAISLARYANDVLNQAYAWFIQGLNYAASLYRSAVGYAAALYNDAIAWTNAVYHALAAALSTAFNDLVRYAADLYNSAIAALERDAAALSNDIAAGVAGAETVAKDLFDAAEQGIATVEHDLVLGLQGVLSEANSHADAVSAAAAAAAAAGVLAQVIPRVVAVTTEVDTCLQPLCDTVTPNAKELGNLGKILGDLEGLAEAGILAGLLAAAVRDPKGTATVVADACGWMTPLGVELADAVGAVVSV